MGTDISFIPTADFPKVMSRVQVREEIERIVHPAQAQKLALRLQRTQRCAEGRELNRGGVSCEHASALELKGALSCHSLSRNGL